MYDAAQRAEARALVISGVSLSSASRATGIARSTIRSWTRVPDPVPGCCRCAGASPALGADYAALLGYYLGDGCVSTHRAHTTLRISCDAALPGIVSDVSRLVGALHPSQACSTSQLRGPRSSRAIGSTGPASSRSTDPVASARGGSRSRTGRRRSCARSRQPSCAACSTRTARGSTTGRLAWSRARSGATPTRDGSFRASGRACEG